MKKPEQRGWLLDSVAMQVLRVFLPQQWTGWATFADHQVFWEAE